MSKAKVEKAGITLRLSDGSSFRWDTKGGAPLAAFLKRLTELGESLDPETEGSEPTGQDREDISASEGGNTSWDRRSSGGSESPAVSTWACVYRECGEPVPWSSWAEAEAAMEAHAAAAPHPTDDEATGRWPLTFRLDYGHGGLPGVHYVSAAASEVSES